jgi:hypothetical protein
MSDWRDDHDPEHAFPQPPPSWDAYGAPAPGYPPGYPYAPGHMPVQQKTDSGATTALVLGILGLFCCLFGFAAIYEGVEARQRIVGDPGALKGEGLALAGVTLGIISLVLTVVSSILFFVL